MMQTLTIVLLVATSASSRFDDAKSVFDAGQQAFEAGQYEAAADAYEQALLMIKNPGERDPRPAIVFSIAQAYRRLYFQELDTNKRNLLALDKAVEAYRRYIVMEPDGTRRPDAESHLATLELELARVSLLGLRRKKADEGRPTSIMITSKTPGALASIDGAETSTVPLVRDVTPGVHKVRVSAEGYFPEEYETTAVKGRLAVVPMNLTEKPASLRVTAPNEAIVSIDGRIIGVAPLGHAVDLAHGRRLLTVTASGRQSYSTEINLERGKSQSLDIDLEPTGQRRAAQYFLIGGGIAATAALVTGIVALVSGAGARVYIIRRDTNGEILTLAELDAYRSNRSRYVDFKASSLTSLIISGVMIGTGAALWAFDAPSSASSPSVTVAPLTSPSGAGVMTNINF